MTPHSLQLFSEQWAKCPDGNYTITIEEGKIGYTPTRYKYYFDCVLREILGQAGRFFRLTVPNTGEERPPNSTEELHEIMKLVYNPIQVECSGQVFTIPGTTTEIRDRDFIGQYVEQIIAEYSGPPYLCEIPSYEEWKEMRKNGTYRTA